MTNEGLVFVLKGMVSGTMSQGVYSSAQQQQSPQQSQQQAQAGNRDNSALIKSLLANKVTPMGVGQAGSMDPLHPHQSPHSRPLLVSSTPPQQPRGTTGAVSYVQALSQGPPGPLGPMLSPTSLGSSPGMQVVSGGLVSQHGPHQPPPPPVQVTAMLSTHKQEEPSSSDEGKLRYCCSSGAPALCGCTAAFGAWCWPVSLVLFLPCYLRNGGGGGGLGTVFCVCVLHVFQNLQGPV